jgi:predicted Rossmann fold nucleotide-binding protein DprA/Smf involved in DNA uptake
MPAGATLGQPVQGRLGPQELPASSAKPCKRTMRLQPSRFGEMPLQAPQHKLHICQPGVISAAPNKYNADELLIRQIIMNTVRIHQQDSRYPAGIIPFLGDSAPQALWAIGNTYLLTGKSMALFCGTTCPNELAVHAYLFAQNLRHSTISLVSGFETPVEQECLKIALDSSEPLIICPARQIDNMRIPEEYKLALEMGRLLILSPYGDSGRATAQRFRARDRLVAAIAGSVMAVYAESDHRSDEFFGEILAWQKPLYTLSHKANRKLAVFGAKAVFPDHKF